MAQGKSQSKQSELKVKEPTIDTSLDLIGVLSAGGMAGQVATLLREIDLERLSSGEVNEVFPAVSSLFMGAFANRASRDEARRFIFDLWYSDEDKQADKDDSRNAIGELPEDLYQQKLGKWTKLPPSALTQILKALFEKDSFKEFLASLRDLMPEQTDESQSTETSTSSNGNTPTATAS